jgi:hypothetical protein
MIVDPVTVAFPPLGVIVAFVRAPIGSELLPCDSTNTASAPSCLADVLVDEGENGRRLRQSTPFAGILTKEERRRILEKHESAGV